MNSLKTFLNIKHLRIFYKTALSEQEKKVHILLIKEQQLLYKQQQQE